MAGQTKVSVCFVCLGNICRSPTAEGVFAHLVTQAGLQDRIRIDSAGTGAWHRGERADKRARTEAGKHGIELTSVARQLVAGDFDRHDLLIVMDETNRAELEQLAPTPEARDKIKLLRAFDPLAPDDAEVPDPYYGGFDGFAHVFSICKSSCEGLLDHIREHYQLD